MWKDRWFWVALLAAPVFWAVLYAMQRPALEPAWPLREPWLFLLPVLVYPVLEEIVFRGLVQELVRDYVTRQRLGFLTWANILTSVLFAGMHFIYHAPLWAAAVFMPSLIFGFFKDKTGKLTAPIVLHVFYNGGFNWFFVTPM